jgi:hypothetical protein
MHQTKITKTDQRAQPRKIENADYRTAATTAPQTCALLDFCSAHKCISVVLRDLAQMTTGVLYLYCFFQAVWADFSFWVLNTHYIIFSIADFSSRVISNFFFLLTKYSNLVKGHKWRLIPPTTTIISTLPPS